MSFMSMILTERLIAADFTNCAFKSDRNQHIFCIKILDNYFYEDLKSYEDRKSHFNSL